MASYLYLSRTKNEIICVEFARVHVYEPKPKLILLSFLILQKNQILRSESGFFVAFCACTLWTLFSRVLIDRCVSYCFYLLVPRSLLTPTESLISFSIRKKNVRIWIINTRKFENSKMSIDFGRGYIYQEVAGSWHSSDNLLNAECVESEKNQRQSQIWNHRNNNNITIFFTVDLLYRLP